MRTKPFDEEFPARSIERPFGAPTINRGTTWYETGLSPKERKRRGHFSTPPELVKHILDACGYTPEADLVGMRVLDPACGSGNFLLEVAHRLLVCSAKRDMDQAATPSINRDTLLTAPQAVHAIASRPPDSGPWCVERMATTLVQRNLWGFDPDPVACFLAEMQLRAVLDVGASAEYVGCELYGECHSERSEESRAHSPSQILSEAKNDVASAHCVQGDITSPILVVKDHDWLKEPPIGLHIHQADALALPWEACVDLVVSNPPYLAAKNNDLSGYQTTQQRGQTDSYLLFLSLAIQALRPGGWMGLVLPDPVLARANATKERERLLKEATIHHIWHLSDVFTADVGAVVIIAQKCSPRSLHQVSWVRGKWQNALPMLRSIEGASQIPQSLFLRQPGAEMRYLLNSARGSVIERLRQQMDEPGAIPCGLAPLSEFFTISRGEELGKDNQFITKSADDAPIVRRENDGHIENNDSSYPILLGGIDICPYTVPTATHWIVREAIVKPLERYQSAKLLVVKSTDRLQAALDKQGHVALQTLYLLRLRTPDTSEDDLYFFLALLNSLLLREYVYMLHTAYKWVQPQIEQSVLARLPIPLVESTGMMERSVFQSSASMRQRIVQMARLLEDACSGGRAVVEWKQDMYDEQERAICALYETVVPGLFTETG